MEKVIEDLFGTKVKVGDTIVYKSGRNLLKSKMIGVSKAGLPGIPGFKYKKNNTTGNYARVPSVTFIRTDFIKYCEP